MKAVMKAWVASAFLTTTFLSVGAAAQLAVSSNDGKGVLVNGVNTVPDNPAPDNISIIDMNASPPKVLATVMVPTSLVGPPQSVAIAPDESFALVTAATQIDPNDKKKLVPHSIVSVIDLTAKPPAVVQTVESGVNATNVAINPAGNLALVTNRGEGTVSVFTIAGKRLTAAGKVTLGDKASSPNAVAFTPDGKRALVTVGVENKTAILNVNGTTVEHSKRDVYGGLRPYPLGISPRGDWAVVGNVGMGGGDSDTISLIDLTANPPRVVDTISTGPTPEGLTIAPDGKHVIVTVINGSSRPPGSPFLNPTCLLPVYAVERMKFRKVAEAKAGVWCQGAAWNKASNLVLVQSMGDQKILMFRFAGNALTPAGAIAVTGGPSGLATSPARPTAQR